MRLLTYNIHKGIGTDRFYRLHRVIEAVKAEEPDVVCLQEVDRNVRRSRFDDQPALLAKALGFESFQYQLNVPRREGGYGNLILSRWPFQQGRQFSLQYRRKKVRGAQVVVVETPHGPLHLVNLHLGLAERERRWQVETLLHHPLFRDGDHHPTLVAGDFNDWRNALGKLRFLPHGFEHATSPPSHHRSFPAFLPIAALDKVFYRGDLRAERARVVRNRLTRRASDHLPVTLDFALTAPSLPPPAGGL
jgi:endonuclease/exonuclease/phosphatase family metal-dependent hydrolase